MSFSRRMVLAVIAVIAIAAGSATATRLEVSSTPFKIVFNPLAITYGTTTIRCPITLEGTFAARSFLKTSGAQIGSLVRSNVATSSCVNGRMTYNNETLPWSVNYTSFSGTLPSISAIRASLVGVSFNIEGPLILPCRFTTKSAESWTTELSREAGGSLTTVGANGTITSETAGCTTATFGERGRISTESGGPIAMRLI